VAQALEDEKMNWDNYYHDGADEASFGDTKTFREEYADAECSFFDYLEYLIDNNITIDWLDPDSLISEQEAEDIWCEATYHISKTWPTDIGIEKPQEYYFERIFKAINSDTEEDNICYIKLADEYEFSYKKTSGSFISWTHSLYTFLFHKKNSIKWMDEPIWKDSLTAESSPADAICLGSIPEEDDNYNLASLKFREKFSHIAHIDKDDLEYLIEAGAISLFELDKYSYVS
jgi:hypothetical protein